MAQMHVQDVHALRPNVRLTILLVSGTSLIFWVLLFGHRVAVEMLLNVFGAGWFI